MLILKASRANMDINYLYNEYKASLGISTDTRHIIADQLFFALRGPNFNANTLAEEALKKGALLAVIDDPEFSHLPKTFLVDDCLEALQQLASHHRSHLDIPVIGLTGSNGKTTTKELLKAVLEKKFHVLATRGNLNNHIGVPLTVLSIEDHDIAIIEMGANHVGEIATLCEISQPTHGLITNIGKAHVGEFGGFENIIRAKSELFDYLLKNNGKAFINTNDPVLKNMAKRFPEPVFYPSGEQCMVQLTGANPFVTFSVNDKAESSSKLFGTYNFSNIAAAICVGRFFGVEIDEAIDAVEEYSPSNNRSQMVKIGTNAIILDAYNANPSSMEVAVQNFGQMNGMNKMVILGDMLELGDEAADEHYKLGELVKKQEFKEAIFVGPLMKAASNAFSEAKYFETKQELTDFFKNTTPENHTILIKGSRGMGLESLMDIFKGH